MHRLGDIPLYRVRLKPAPGTATEKDLLRLMDKEGRLCELIDGVLVEKTMGLRESYVAVALISFLQPFARTNDLGFVTGSDGAMRLWSNLVRIPDVSFVSWDQLPEKYVPDEPIPDLAPRLAVEVLSEGNTKAEMQIKVKEYFQAGTLLVWLIDPDTRTATVHTSPDDSRKLTETDTLDGGAMLPGFRLVLKELFAQLKPNGGAAKKGKKRGRK